MPLFQKSVQKKFIKDLDKAKVEVAYQKFVAYFGDNEVQQNIRKAKEEQYQEGFLGALFVDVLGFVLNPEPNYNLITEQKNERNSKKADGAILKNNRPIAVIELKSVRTTDLQAIEIQAFNYKNNQTDCVYVITSNFQKIRFYIENAVEFEEFDLFDLTKERFDLLYLCLQADGVLSDLPLRIKQASLEREESITKKLYADYSLFKQALFKDISARNKGYDTLTLLKKIQKLLDRFLFIFFAEDKGLLPPNSVSEILNQWDKLRELDAYQPLYNRFMLYFGYLNNGHKGKNYDIFAYNGGLFASDDVLDNIKITDNILYNHCQRLSHYDFDTEIDTNILGHIFEHSLNEIDEVVNIAMGHGVHTAMGHGVHTAMGHGVHTAMGHGVHTAMGHGVHTAMGHGVHTAMGHAPLATQEAAPLAKRKKDGIFYTPRYITKYIVESTVGELCKQKKVKLGLDTEALVKADTQKDRKTYQTKIDDYRKWLLQLTILDPACGSGAFLNQAFEFLLQEHRLIDSMSAMLFGDSLIMTDNVAQILENNIYGVDINEESVEIAKLSLWLRTAKVGRKLNDLSRNIKRGNSLISDPSIAGDLAFDWQKSFPQVFQEKEKNAWHVTCVMHNTRTSQRMIDYHVKKGIPEWLLPHEEIKLAEIIRDIALADDLNIVELNICADHLHLVLIAENEAELTQIVGKIKSMSARQFNIWRGITVPQGETRGHAPLQEPHPHAPLQEPHPHAPLQEPHPHAPLQNANNHLWAQKFNRKPILSYEQLGNTLQYIENNRIKHGLPDNPELRTIINQFVKDWDTAMRPEYSGGFDVVVGNPPYVLCQPSNTDESTLNYYKKYEVASYKIDLFHLFFEKGIHILAKNGQLGFITPNTYLTNKHIQKLRHFILKKTQINSIVSYQDTVFADAGVDVATIIVKKTSENTQSNEVQIYKSNLGVLIEERTKYQSSWIDDAENVFNLNPDLKINFTDCVLLVDICKTYFGIQAFDRDSSISAKPLNENYLPIIDGGDIYRYEYAKPNKYFNYIAENIKSGGDKAVYQNERIVIRQIGKTPIVGYCHAPILTSNTLYNVYLSDDNYNLKYILCVLNSKLMKSFWLSTYSDNKDLFPKIKGYQLKKLPVKITPFDNQLVFAELADTVLNHNEQLKKQSTRFIKLLQSSFLKLVVNKKIESWYELSFGEFRKELEKQKIVIPIKKLMDYQELFETNATQIKEIQTTINNTDKTIDRMIYTLYDLTNEEIQFVESQ